MSTQAQYATIPKIGRVAISTANTAKDGTGTMGTVATGSPTIASGTRLDRLSIQAAGDTTTGMIRFFLMKGQPGATTASITFSGTTATLTTVTPHGMTTGDFVTVQNALPDNYNMTNAAITVTGATSFTYVMSVAPTINASTVGGYSIVKAAEVATLWREIPVTASVVNARTISTITNATTTATLTTTTAHGLSTGDTIVVTGASPAAYNGTFTITVTTSTAFTYVMASNPGSSASPVGSYSVVKQAFSRGMYSQQTADAAYLPLLLPPGWQLRASTNNAESFNITTTFTGDTA